MAIGRLVGLVVFATGILFLGFAYNATNAPLEELSNTLTGRYSSETMWYLVLGIAFTAIGGLIAVFGRRA